MINTSDLTDELLEKMKTDGERLAATYAAQPYLFFPHIAHSIYGLPIKQTEDVVVISCFTGSGKTHDLIEWLSVNYKNKGQRRIVVALKEIRLIAEFVCSLYDKIGSRSKSERNNIAQHVSLVFGDVDTTVDKIRSDLRMASTDKEKNDFTAQLNFLAHTSASTKLDRERVQALFDAKLIITTHASMLNLASVGITAGADSIFDEGPSYYINCHGLTWEQMHIDGGCDKHILSIVDDAYTIDECKKSSRQIGKRMTKGIFKVSDCYKLSKSEVLELSADGKDFDPSDEPFPTAFAGFFFTYCDFSSFKSNSVTILTACPEGTDLAWIQQLSGVKFAQYETEKSIKKRKQAWEYCQLLCVPGNISCAKSNKTSKENVALMEGYKNCCIGVAPGDSYVIAHAHVAKYFTNHCIPVCKLDCTGSNAYMDKRHVFVASLPFMSPKERLVAQKVFKDNFEEFDKWQQAAKSGQSTMRSALRKIEIEPCRVFYSDLRVKWAWARFCGVFE